MERFQPTISTIHVACFVPVNMSLLIKMSGESYRNWVLVIENVLIDDNRDYPHKNLWGKMSVGNFLHESVCRRNVRPVCHLDRGCMDWSLVMAWHFAWQRGRAVHRASVWTFWHEYSQRSDGSWLTTICLFSRLERWAKFLSHLSKTWDAVRCPGTGCCRYGSSCHCLIGLPP